MLMSKMPLLLPASHQYIKELILHSFLPLSGVAHYIFLFTVDKKQSSALLACGNIGYPRMSSFSKWSFPTDVTRKQNTCEGTEQLLLTNLPH